MNPLWSAQGSSRQVRAGQFMKMIVGKQSKAVNDDVKIYESIFLVRKVMTGAVKILGRNTEKASIF